MEVYTYLGIPKIFYENIVCGKCVLKSQIYWKNNSMGKFLFGKHFIRKVSRQQLYFLLICMCSLLICSFEYDPKLADCSEANINHFRKFSEESKLNMVYFSCVPNLLLLFDFYCVINV